MTLIAIYAKLPNIATYLLRRFSFAATKRRPRHSSSPDSRSLYTFVRIIAENALGQSRPSAVINVTTEEEAPSGFFPREVQVYSTSAQSIKVT
ncbi:hypothetical protein CEXT_471901 [Caerostris extrusa]|uniref:Uncharacterized protein n=1 Tax=Caerostris extrusa TaxID=172846 RepID=A0AAV4RNN0_CAEEX|nr:hypothetical protein CEXT_471901 [Caerostris extrusa]